MFGFISVLYSGIVQNFWRVSCSLAGCDELLLTHCERERETRDQSTDHHLWRKCILKFSQSHFKAATVWFTQIEWVFCYVTAIKVWNSLSVLPQTVFLLLNRSRTANLIFLFFSFFFFCCNTAPDTRESLCVEKYTHTHTHTNAYKIDVAWMLIRFNNFIVSYEQRQNLEHTGSGSGLE